MRPNREVGEISIPQDREGATGVRPMTAATSPPLQVAGPSAVKYVAWTPAAELDVREWAEAGRRMGSVGRNIQWLLGDWITYGNQKFGERYARAAKITGYDPQTLMNMVYVATRFSISRRRENLSWSHHEALASREVEEQDRWLDQAALHHWSVLDLRTMLRMAKKGQRELVEAAVDEKAEAHQSSSLVKCPRCGEEITVD
jgi:hypothetical protein